MTVSVLVHRDLPLRASLCISVATSTPESRGGTLRFPGRSSLLGPLHHLVSSHGGASDLPLHRPTWGPWFSHLNAWVQGQVGDLRIPGHWADLISLEFYAASGNAFLHGTTASSDREARPGLGKPGNLVPWFAHMESPSLPLLLRLSFTGFQPFLVAHSHAQC